MSYDKENIFAKMINGEIPCDKVFENEYCLAFYDIQPAAPVHILVIPKGEYVSFSDFSQDAEPEFISSFFKSIKEIVDQENLGEDGYRLITNHGHNGSQSVFHFHVHILAGKQLGGLLQSDEFVR